MLQPGLWGERERGGAAPEMYWQDLHGRIGMKGCLKVSKLVKRTFG